MAKAKRSYTPMPLIEPAVGERLEKVLEVMAGRLTVAQAARDLGISRNHFQTILHRGLAGLAEAITPRTAGRPATPGEVSALEQQLEGLRRENTRLKEQAGTTERLLQVASGLLQGRSRPARQARTKKAAGARDEDAEPEPSRRLEAIEQMRRLGITAEQAARVAGMHPATARRWRARGAPCRRSREAPIAFRVARQVDRRVRKLHGMVGAESLRRGIAGVSRRQAARLKASTLTAMERERKAALHRVCLSTAGLVRGMDGMCLSTAHGRLHALFTCDAAIPYRTSVTAGSHYDARLVVRALSRDIKRNGAPLVYRLDRARAHDAPEVRQLLDRYAILALHGPPHCPRFYGQLERQNREHRAWNDELAMLDATRVESRLRSILKALNNSWPRRALGWRTPREAWEARAQPHVDRVALRKEVHERAARIARSSQLRGKPADLAWRLAIEQALQSRGFLRQTSRGWC